MPPLWDDIPYNCNTTTGVLTPCITCNCNQPTGVLTPLALCPRSHASGPPPQATSADTFSTQLLRNLSTVCSAGTPGLGGACLPTIWLRSCLRSAVWCVLAWHITTAVAAKHGHAWPWCNSVTQLWLRSYPSLAQGGLCPQALPAAFRTLLDLLLSMEEGPCC